MSHIQAWEKQFAKRLREALMLSHGDICSSLCDELNDMFPGEYAYIRDIYGDSESGDVVYSCSGETWKAPYTITMVNGKRDTEIDDDQAINVVPRTVYDEEIDEEDHYAGMTEEAAREARAMTADERRMILSERFISKSERDAADPSDFAGKGKSFPILKPSDVMAAVRAMGRAGADNKSTAALKASIIRIAKRKGFAKYLPKAWQGGEDKTAEAAATRAAGGLKLIESASLFGEVISFTESASVATIPIKLIGPGKGSMAIYPAEVLKRDGPKVYKAGTHVYVNHPTAAEEAARPEGDVKNLAGVLATDAKWHDSYMHKGKDRGPGLYSEVKPFSDHAVLFNEKGEFLGMSIRASGIAESGRRESGLPVLKELTSAESVDVVTRAGAGGMILSEAARPQSQTTQEVNLTEDEAKKLIEAAVEPFRKRAIRGDAREAGERLLEGVGLPAKAKARIIDRVLENLPLTEAGELDEKKFRESVVAEAKAEGEYLAEITGAGQIRGMGSLGIAEAAQPDKKALKEAKREAKEQRREDVDVFESLMGNRDAAKFAVKGRVA